MLLFTAAFKDPFDFLILHKNFQGCDNMNFLYKANRLCITNIFDTFKCSLQPLTDILLLPPTHHHPRPIVTKVSELRVGVLLIYQVRAELSDLLVCMSIYMTGYGHTSLFLSVILSRSALLTSLPKPTTSTDLGSNSEF